MNLKQLFEIQRKLDEHIESNHPRQEGEDRIQKKVLALIVEIAELANETRCFKFWSNKGPSEREVILEEGVDVLHFLLSIGNEIEIGEYKIHEYTITENCNLDKLFDSLIDQARVCYIERQWKHTFSLYLKLMASLGFTKEEIVDAYLLKNQKNHERQNQGY